MLLWQYSIPNSGTGSRIICIPKHLFPCKISTTSSTTSHETRCQITCPNTFFQCPFGNKPNNQHLFSPSRVRQISVNKEFILQKTLSDETISSSSSLTLSGNSTERTPALEALFPHQTLASHARTICITYS